MVQARCEIWLGILFFICCFFSCTFLPLEHIHAWLSISLLWGPVFFAHGLPCKTWQTSLGRSSMSLRSCHRCCRVASPGGRLFFHATSILSFCMVTSFSAAWMSSSWLELSSRWMATSFHSLPSLFATISSCFSDASAAPPPLWLRPAVFTPSEQPKGFNSK